MDRSIDLIKWNKPHSSIFSYLIIFIIDILWYELKNPPCKKRTIWEKKETSEKGKEKRSREWTQSKHILYLSHSMFMKPVTVCVNILQKSRMESDFYFMRWGENF